MSVGPQTKELCWKEIRRLKLKLKHARIQLKADSEAMHQLVDKVQEVLTNADKEMFEKCKHCTKRSVRLD